MNVLQLHARYRGRGGEDSTVAYEHDLLTRAGHGVRLIEGQNSPSAPGAVAQLAWSPWNPAAARRTVQAIDDLRPDVVHVHNTWYSLTPSVLAAARRKGVPVVMTVQNYRLVCVSSNLFRDGRMCEDCVGRGPWRGVLHRCYHDSAVASGIVAANITLHRKARTWHREVDVVVAVSEYGVDRHVAGGVPREKIVVKDNFAPDPGGREGPPSTSRDVIFVGRAGPEKGLQTLLAHWRVAAPRGLRLIVIGAVESQPETPGVRFVGPLPPDEVRDRMKRARALVIPSQWPEGQPLVLLEALAAGLPVIGSALGGIDEVLGDSPTSWRVRVGDAEGWRAAIGELADGDTLDRAGRDSRRLYEQRFTVGAALPALERVYRMAIERRGPELP